MSLFANVSFATLRQLPNSPAPAVHRSWVDREAAAATAALTAALAAEIAALDAADREWAEYFDSVIEDYSA